MRKLLITDDDPALLALYQAFLRNVGNVKVDYATTPEAARCCLRDHSYDLAFFDLNLTAEHSRDGLDLLAIMKSRAPKSRVIMMSSDDDQDTVRTCLAKGATTFVPKRPGFMNDLVRIARTPAA